MGLSVTSSVWLGDAFAIFLVRNVVMRLSAARDRCQMFQLVLTDALSTLLAFFLLDLDQPGGWVIRTLA